MLHFSFAYRYLKGKKTANAINIIAWICVSAIALGTAALVLVMSVFNGFEDMVKQLYGTFYTDLRVIPASSKFLLLENDQLNKINGIPGIRAATAVIEERAILQNGEEQTIISLKGVRENYGQVADIPKAIIKGKFATGTEDEPQLVLGAGVEIALNTDAVKAATPITIYLPKQNSNSAISPSGLSVANAVPSGTFGIQDEFNTKYAFTNLAFMQKYLAIAINNYSAVEIALKNNVDEKEIKDQLQKMLGNRYTVQTRYEQNKVLYSAMQLEKWFIYGVLSLIMIIFSFTVISTLSMLVIEKQKDISVMKAMGANNSFVRKIFLSEGLLLSGIGGSVGLAISLILCWLQIKYKLIKLSGNTFLIDYYPVKVLPMDLMIIVTTVVLISFIAAWIPAVKAGKKMIELRGID